MNRSTRRGSASTVIALLVAVSACGSGGTGVLPDVDVVAMTSGEQIDLGDLDGPAVVNLWFSTCAPCLKEMPDFEAVYRRRGDEVAFVGINIGEDAERAGAFTERVGVTYPQYLDQLGSVQTELGVTTMPTTVVIDADGAIVERHSGPMSQDQLDAAIDTALGRATSGDS
jgi:thiol-disulfide isomerase/thioredoxin